MPLTIHSHPQPSVTARSEARDHRVERERVERVRVDRVRIERERTERPRWNRIDPVVVSHATYTTTWTPAPSYTYEPAELPTPSYTYQPEVQLLAPTSLASGELAIDTGPLGASTALELAASGSGSTYVTQLVVYSADGQSQVIPVGQLLSAASPAVRLSIDNCGAITRIVIDGHSEWGSMVGLRAI